MQRYLISYEFTDGEDQEEGAEMLINWYESGGPQNRPENYEVHSWIFMVQNGIGHSVVSADSSWDNLEAMASLEKVNGYKYSAVYGSWWDSRIIQKNKKWIQE